MKYCLADRLGIYVDAVYGNLVHHNGTTFLLTSFLYTIQIYADFAGYSLLAIGLGKLLGIELQENFVRPYFSKTVTEFWRRWHISLTTWFRDYIYFPLGGNRVSKARWMLNTLIVFVASGLWHGASYTFLIWGLLHGVLMIIERLIYGQKIKQISDRLSFANAIRILFTFCVISFTWIFFRANTLEDAFFVIKSIFVNHGELFIDINTFALAMLAIIIVFLYDFANEYMPNVRLLSSRNKFIRFATAVLLCCFILAFGVLNNGSFIYFQF